MKPERRLKLTLKALNRELKEYLKAFDPTHPYYKRNIKNLYEGLNELGIFDDIQTVHSFKEFEKAFHKADKGLKQALIVSHVFEDTSLTTYFSHKGQPLSRIKLIGNVFVARQPQANLNEYRFLTYIQKLQEKQMMAQDRQDLKQIKEGLKEFKRKIKLADKKDTEVWRAIYKYIGAAKAIEDTWGLSVDIVWKKKIKEEVDGGYMMDTGETKEVAVDADKYVATAEDLISEYENNIDEIIEELELNYQNKIIDLKKYETLQDEAIRQVKLKDDIGIGVLNSVTARLKILQSTVQEKTTTLTQEIPNVVKGLTDVIDLRKRLYIFLQFLDSKRMSLNEPWRVAEFRSGGSRGRSRAVSKLAVEIGINPQDAEITMGNSRQSFHKRDLSWIVKEIQHKYEFYFTKALELIPQSTLRSAVTDLLHYIAQLNNYLMTDFEEEAHVERNFLGQIINYDEHALVMQAHKEILAAFAACINQTKYCIAECDRFVEYNEQAIAEAKGDKTTLRRQITKLVTGQKTIDKIVARRELRLKELGARVKEKEKKKDDANKNDLIDGLYALE